ncbi:Xylose isomerase domain protein TIM barrel [Chthoniobacter flavus Ellin428]|uniref:Xylose isomerase domain protein TIM barrel n=1 Tax=Chthoniobacter flavus Ellin428 TaxID=497964 RepID=B4D2S0_9BACT|nr:TIM barrel protein [Chthoniobacter flavus]EDY19031.1 Xylose isomerase domain protein TIM barrel [Chthoniobacter flavus Ellin428]TCO86794.1 secreted protein [Chthoniobacter flavus]
MITRRTFLQALGAAAVGSAVAAPEPFRLRYVLSSALYGETPLDIILPEVSKAGCEAIDIWCRAHGNQREQITEMGDDAFAALLAKNHTQLGVTTRYPLGPFKLQEEMVWLKKLGGKIALCGCSGAKNPQGAEAKAAIQEFIEKMKPHVAKAEELGVTIAIENHANTALHHPDSLRYFAEFNHSPAMGVAFAFHHLHEWQEQIPTLLRDLGAAQLPFIYFQEYSEGISKKVAKEIEMQQMPGFGGSLDYHAVLKAMREIRFAGVVSLFMHPTPRGVPILPTTAEVTAAVNKSRAYVEGVLKEIA